MPWHCPASNSHKFSLLLLIPWMVSKLVKPNYWNLLFFINTGPCDSDCSQCIPAYRLRSSTTSAYTASGILEHSKVLLWVTPFLLSINHASSQKNSSSKSQKTCWPLIPETAYNTDFLLPDMKERVLACLEVSMVVCLKTPLFWGTTTCHLNEFLFSNNSAWVGKFYYHVSWDFYGMKSNLIP